MEKKLALLLIIVIANIIISLAGNTVENIAVLDFEGKNISAVDASVLTDFLRTATVNMHDVKIIDRKNMELILKEQGLQMSGCTSEKCAVRIGKILNVEKIIIGTISRSQKKYFITGNVVDVETGQIITSKRVTCETAASIVTKMDELAEILMKRQVIADTGKDEYIHNAIDAIKTESYDIAIHNLKMAILEKKDKRKAKSLLMKVYYLTGRVEWGQMKYKLLPYLMELYWISPVKDKEVNNVLKYFNKISRLEVKLSEELCQSMEDTAEYWFETSEKDRDLKILSARILTLLKNRKGADWLLNELDLFMLQPDHKNKDLEISESIVIGRHLGPEYIKDFKKDKEISPALSRYLDEIVTSGIIAEEKTGDAIK